MKEGVVSVKTKTKLSITSKKPINKRKETSEKEDNYNSIKSYLKEVANYKLLNADEEKELSRKIEAGDNSALDILIQSNLRLVIKIARSFTSKGYPLVDLIQDGNIGLIRAAQKFDYRKNVRFSTYAAQWIKQMIIRSLTERIRIVRLPYRKEKILRQIKKIEERFKEEFQTMPTVKQIADELKLQEAEVKHVKQLEIHISSLEGFSEESSSFTLEKVLCSNNYNPSEELSHQELIKETQNAVESLVPKEQCIVTHRFGLGAQDKQTLKQMGEKFHISPETVRQIENRSLRKLEENYSYLKNYLSH